MFDYRFSAVLKNYGKLRVQVCRFMHTAFYIIFAEPCLLKYLRVRKKINLCSCFFGFSGLWQKSVFKFYHRFSLRITVMVYVSVLADFHVHIGGKCIHDRRADAMKASARFICIIIKFTACMQRGKHNARRRYSLGMHTDRNPASVILHGTGAVCFKRYPDGIACPRQMLVHRIIHNLINQMVQPPGGHTSDIHSRTLPDSLQAFQNRYTACIIF